MSMDLMAYLLDVAGAVAKRSTCRRKVGCVLADERGKILASGYNGPPRGVPHCDARGCDQLKGCSGNDKPGCNCSVIPGRCDAVHAEQNALLQCADVMQVFYVAVTRAPCMECTKMLLNSGAMAVVYSEPSSYEVSREYFINARRLKARKASWSRQPTHG